MSVTQSQLDQLVKAWSQAVSSSRAGDRGVEFRSRLDMEAQIARMAQALGVPNPIAGARKPVRQIRIATSKGVR